ncbi:nicolin-1-like [Plakobranchus ocellatus]|uniref:Nicolin-1-like n=1 Tax=Plakobranchus ocellatus TaxID=259542 RepID=A0AAV4B9L0_9GAST|nr:nicolin-1-like [Plakobranchus ocellatus]
MNDKPLSCNVKPAVSPTVDSRLGSQTGCKIIDITFPNVVNPEVGEIRFQNYYVAFLTVKAKIKLTEQTPREGPNDHGWRMVVRRLQLMPDPHTETGAQDCFVITRSQFVCELSQVVSLRLILQQPSPLWKDFSLEDLKLFKTSGGSRVPPLPSWFMEDDKPKANKKELEGVPDLDSLSTNLQQLWALAEEVSANQTEESLGRYEVDGCYDINLLAYS